MTRCGAPFWTQWRGAMWWPWDGGLVRWPGWRLTGVDFLLLFLFIMFAECLHSTKSFRWSIGKSHAHHGTSNVGSIPCSCFSLTSIEFSHSAKGLQNVCAEHPLSSATLDKAFRLVPSVTMQAFGWCRTWPPWASFSPLRSHAEDVSHASIKRSQPHIVAAKCMC